MLLFWQPGVTSAEHLIDVSVDRQEDQRLEMHKKCFFLRLELQLEFPDDCALGPLWFHRHMSR